MLDKKAFTVLLHVREESEVGNLLPTLQVPSVKHLKRGLRKGRYKGVLFVLP